MKKVLLFLMALLPLFVSSQVKRTIHVATAGTLPTLISEEEKYQIEELTLSGELNGTDFKFIRDMAGVIDEVKEEFDGDKIRWVEYLSTEGILKSINLAESKIVSGGIPYYLEGDRPMTGTAWIEKYYTESDAISSYLFARTKLETIILPNSITSIGACVFFNCNRLTSITIPYSVTSISGVAFGGSCLTSIQVESGNNKYDSRNNCNAIIDSNNQLIAGCKNTIIPNSVTSIGDYAFYGCSGLASITIPNNVTSIGNGAFSGCSGLTSIIIPNSVTTIGEDAFCGCSGLTSITIPNKVTSISNGAFQGCSGLTSFTIPNSVTSIGGDAFHGCSGLTSITIGNNVTSIGDYAFYGCSGLASITIPNNVTSIGWETFYGCSGLTSITIGKNVTSIRRGAFGGCSALTASIKVENGNQKYDSRNNCNAIIETSSNTMILGCKNTTIPNTVTSIGYNAFYGCSGLTSINIPDNVTSIGSSAFSGCSGLTSVTIGKNVTSIGDYTFYGCSGLKSVTSLNPVPPSIIGTSLGSVYENAALNVPHGSKEAYMNADYWKLFKTINEVGDINGDGNLDSADIKEIENYIMGNPSPNFDVKIADINNDGVVNVADIVCITKVKYSKYLTFVAIDDGKFKLSGNSVQYSLDEGSTWNTLASGVITPMVIAGQKIMWKGNLTPSTTLPNYGIGTFSSTGRFSVEGNVMSLLYGDNYEGQTSLADKDYAFFTLFGDCTGLTSAEHLCLPATTLANYCYNDMFDNCTSLTTAPELPATKLANYCYSGMFWACASLINAPELPATTLANGCFSSMFSFCTSLTTAPELPALTLREYCYNDMFDNCTSLTTAPALPATTLAKDCYHNMFYKCTSLTTAPELPAKTLADGCYSGMFQGCTSLNYIKCLATDVSATGCTTDWVCGVASTGTFVKPTFTLTPWITGVDGIPSGWTVQDNTTPGNDKSGNYLTFVAQETGTFKFTGSIIHYSLDNGYTWNTLASNTDSPIVSQGQKIMWKGTLTPKSNYGIGTFSSTGRFTVEGNAMSLLYGDNFIGQTSLSGKDYAHYYLFSGCTGLTSAENLVLPSTTLAISCYCGMFQGCTSLTTAPELPATQLDWFCYNSMFDGCASLATAPELPATTLATSCYFYMFKGCTSLNSIKCLATDISADRCTVGWVQGVSSRGTFIKAVSMSNWERGVDGIPYSWTVQDDIPSGNDNNNNNNANGDFAANYLTFVAQETGTFKFGGIRGIEGISYSLDEGSTWYTLARNTDSPTVSAGNKIMWKGLLTPLSSYEDGIGTFSSTGRFTVEGNIMSLLYGDDFQNKTSLSGKDFAFAGLFSSCTGLTSAENLVLPATTLASDCYYYMFRGCTSLTAAPSVLPATKLSFSCYEAMFSGCTSLTTAPELPATTLAYSCYSNMFNGCTSLNNIKCLATDISATNCTYNWVNGVSSSGTFVKAQGTVWTTGVSGIPSGWTMQNDTPSGTADGDKITDDEGNNSSSNIVGVWEVTSIETNVSVRNAIGEKIHFNADGTYSDPLDSGRWSLSGNKLTIIFSTPDMVPVEFLVLALTDSELSLKAVLDEFSGKQFSHLSVRIIIHFKRVG